jgi:hypothetical protein
LLDLSGLGALASVAKAAATQNDGTDKELEQKNPTRDVRKLPSDESTSLSFSYSALTIIVSVFIFNVCDRNAADNKIQ